MDGLLPVAIVECKGIKERITNRDELGYWTVWAHSKIEAQKTAIDGAKVAPIKLDVRLERLVAWSS